MEKWYKTSFRRNLVDMHIPDWDDKFLSKFNVEEYVKKLKYADVDTAYIYASSSVGICNWPTKVGHMHKAFEGRDVISELMNECRKNGIRPILYLNVWSRYAFDNHNDWGVLSPEGKNSLEFLWLKNRFGVCCCNSPYADYFYALVEELTDRYDTEALWVDMVLWATVCTCEHCRARFKKETGFDLPKTVDWQTKEWTLFIKKRIEWLNGFLAEIERRAKKKNPELDLLYNSVRYNCWGAGVSIEGYGFSEFLTGDFTDNRPYHSFYCKFANAVSKNKPPEFLCPVMAELEHHNVVKTVDQLKVLLFSCYTNNLRFGFIDAIDPIGTFNGIVYERMREVYSYAKPYEKYLESDVDFIADAAVYITVTPEADEDENGKPLFVRGTHTPHMDRSRSLGAFLRDSHIAHVLITKNDLKNLNKYKTIFLCDAGVLSDAETAAFCDYVKGGGNMYISGASGLYDESYNKTDGRLKEITGAKIIGKAPHGELYISPCESSADKFLYFTPEHPLALGTEKPIEITALDGAEIRATFTYPYSAAGDKRFSSAISNPPWFKSNKPAILLNQCKKGKVLFSAYPLEILKNGDQRTVFVNLLKEVLPEDRAYTTDAPPCIEVTAYRQKRGNIVLNVFNDQVAEHNIPIYNFSVRLKCENPPKTVVEAPRESVVDYKCENGYITIKIERLDIFKMFIVEF